MRISSSLATGVSLHMAGEYEYCKVCRINHDQGRRHKYLPSHVSSLSSYLSRFLTKLSDVRFFLKDPIPLNPDLSHHNRLWCVFCDVDIVEVGSSVACGNAINHLAGADHLKNVKSFLWKFGGKMDQVDSFRVSEADLLKWKKKCKSLKNSAAGEGSGKPSIGPSNDIHNELNSNCVGSHENNNNHFIRSSFSNYVMPLQNHTNERYQECYSEVSEASGFSPPYSTTTSYSSGQTCSKATLLGSNNSIGRIDNQQSLVCYDKKWAGNGFFSNGGLFQVQPDPRIVDEGSSTHGLQKLTQISSLVQGNEGNVHTGAPPPWLDSSEKSLLDTCLKLDSGSRNHDYSVKNSGKTKKLNPKRVGAAWAEKRKIELEMEKRGEIVAKSFGDDWLPNFGRVWQSGTRKESRKEFSSENKGASKSDSQSETLIEIQPYVSKRKRMKTDQDE